MLFAFTAGILVILMLIPTLVFHLMHRQGNLHESFEGNDRSVHMMGACDSPTHARTTQGVFARKVA